jgi:hypothetical protein
MSAESTRELDRLLREAGDEELAQLVTERIGEIDVRAARQAFRNPFLSGPLIEALLAAPGLAAAYDVRREAAFHPRTPRLLALRCVTGLYWADLVRLGLDTRLHPVVRRSADQRLIERIPGLAVGERIAVARKSSTAVISALRADPTPRVIGALLENPRLTEGLLMPLVAGESTSPQVLAKVASNPRWGVRPAIRFAICRNPSTPPAAALAALPMLAKRELEAIANDLHLTLPVRRRAQLLSGTGGGPGGRRGGRRP